MAVLSEHLSNPLKNHLLSGVCLRVTEKDSSRRQIIEEFLHYLFERKHTRWDNRNIVELRSQERFGWSGKSVLMAGLWRSTSLRVRFETSDTRIPVCRNTCRMA